MNYAWNFGDLLEYLPLWWRGLTTTLFLSASSIVLGSLLALALFVFKKSKYRLLRLLATSYIDTFRALPVFVLLSLLFFVAPIVIGLRLSAWQCCVIGFSMNLAPFAAECIRAGIESIPAVQYESAKVLGMTHQDIFRYIIAPQAVQRIIPPLLGEYITTIKLTSLAGVIGVEEIWNIGGQIVSRTSLTIEARIVAALLYIAIILPLIWWLNKLENTHTLRGSIGYYDPNTPHVHSG